MTEAMDDADPASSCSQIMCKKNASMNMDAITFWMNGIFSSILVIIGLIGNTAVVVSFHFGDARMKQRRRQAFYYYLITFAVWNTGLLLATVLFNCIPALSDHDTVQFSDMSYLIGYLCGNCCVTANVWLAVVVTIERFLAVSRPLQSRLTSPRRRAKIVCTFLSILVIVYNLPLVFELTFTPYRAEDAHELEDTDLDELNSTLMDMHSEKHPIPPYKLSLSSMRDNVYYQLLYRVVANFVFVSFVPFAVVLLLTIRIVCLVRESNRRRARFRKSTLSSADSRTGFLHPVSSNGSPMGPQSNAKNGHADVVLTLIAAKFLIFYSLPVVINIVELTTDARAFELEDSHASQALKFLVDLSNLLVVLDGATNSFFYFSWKNSISTYRLGATGALRSNYGWMNLESRTCGHAPTAAASDCMLGIMGDYGIEKRRSKIEWTPSFMLESAPA